MAALKSPVELPTGRESMVDFPLTASIHDTNWDVLSSNGKHAKRSSKSSNAPESTGQPLSKTHLHHRTKSSSARELPPQELDAGPILFPTPRAQSSLSQSTWNNSSTQLAAKEEDSSQHGHTAQTSDDSTGSTKSASTAGTASVKDSQVYTLPSTETLKEEQPSSPVILPSRSGNASVRSKVPTSKYKKKAPGTVKSTLSRKSGVETPLASPMSSYTHIIQSPTLAEMQAPFPTELPSSFPSPLVRPSKSLPPPENSTEQAQRPSLQHTKSTASVRKARALHSHPSMPVMRPGDPMGSPMIPEPSPTTSALRNRKSIDAPRGRPSLVDLQRPSPAPDTPLPDLPPGIPPLSRPSSSHTTAQSTPQLPPDVFIRPGTSTSSVAPTLRRQETNQQSHAEMASFMTSTSKIIFRRFHDVHVRLLLSLQDEISALEKELAEVEGTGETLDGDQEAHRVRILSELRKLLAEYDHLFSNWNVMQANEADAKTRDELATWLQRPGATGGGGLSHSAKEDLRWLQKHHGDLSSVDLNAKSGSTTVTAREVSREGEKAKGEKSAFGLWVGGASGGSHNARGGAGGFVSLFSSCAGKRK